MLSAQSARSTQRKTVSRDANAPIDVSVRKNGSLQRAWWCRSVEEQCLQLRPMHCALNFLHCGAELQAWISTTLAPNWPHQPLCRPNKLLPTGWWGRCGCKGVQGRGKAKRGMAGRGWGGVVGWWGYHDWLCSPKVAVFSWQACRICRSESLYIVPRLGRPRAWKPQRPPASRAIRAMIRALSLPASRSEYLHNSAPEELSTTRQNGFETCAKVLP
mmetsp:Transcript_59344/g.193570  ORF Transcript_59344/g.193570 Transcript_59344/m.193570 type:complete len:216 (+) Transcript_59344:194-841(+)